MDSYTPSLAELEARLAKLERQNRRWKHLGLLFLLIAGSGFLLAQAPRKPPSAAPGPATSAATYDTLVVHRLELRDKAGKLRGAWSVEDGSPFLALYDTAGEPRVVLSVAADGPALGFYDAAAQFGRLLMFSGQTGVLDQLLGRILSTHPVDNDRIANFRGILVRHCQENPGACR